MKLIRRVSALQVKRTFVISNLASHMKGRHFGKVSKEAFEKNLARAKAKVLKMNAKAVDRQIKDPKRLAAYNAMKRWYIAEAKTTEVAVWKKAGGLPLDWTRGNLAQTGKLVRQAMAKKSKRLRKRAKRAIPAIMATSLDASQKDKYLLPIILPGGTYKACRRDVKIYKGGDIDDGCMRSITLAVTGRKVIRAYVGREK